MGQDLRFNRANSLGQEFEQAGRGVWAGQVLAQDPDRWGFLEKVSSQKRVGPAQERREWITGKGGTKDDRLEVFPLGLGEVER